MGFSYQRSHSRIPGWLIYRGVSFGLRYTPSPRFSLDLSRTILTDLKVVRSPRTLHSTEVT